MGKGGNKNHVSFWFWMFALFVAAIPCIGFIMVIIWAIFGENESRKNYFRALLAWHVIGLALCLAILLLGFGPEIVRQVQLWIQPAK